MDKIEQKKRSKKFRKHLRYNGEVKTVIKKEELFLNAKPNNMTGLPIGTHRAMGLLVAPTPFPKYEKWLAKRRQRLAVYNWIMLIFVSIIIGILLGLLLINF